MSLKQEGHGNSALRVRSKGKQRRVLGGHGGRSQSAFPPNTSVHDHHSPSPGHSSSIENHKGRKQRPCPHAEVCLRHTSRWARWMQSLFPGSSSDTSGANDAHSVTRQSLNLRMSFLTTLNKVLPAGCLGFPSCVLREYTSLWILV